MVLPSPYSYPSIDSPPTNKYYRYANDRCGSSYSLTDYYFFYGGSGGWSCLKSMQTDHDYLSSRLSSKALTKENRILIVLTRGQGRKWLQNAYSIRVPRSANAARGRRSQKIHQRLQQPIPARFPPTAAHLSWREESSP